MYIYIYIYIYIYDVGLGSYESDRRPKLSVPLPYRLPPSPHRRAKRWPSAPPRDATADHPAPRLPLSEIRKTPLCKWGGFKLGWGGGGLAFLGGGASAQKEPRHKTSKS